MTAYVKHCDKCQRFASAHHSLLKELCNLSSPWPFHKWGIDIIRPFPMAVGPLKFIVVEINYFTKWIKAEPLTTITTKRIKRFIWKNIICWYSLLGVLSSNDDTQFTKNRLYEFCQELDIYQIFTSVEHL